MAKQTGPRPLWTGAISFGLVNIPIKLYTAVREENVHFHLLHDQDHARLRRKLVCSADGSEVHPEHQVKGYEIAPDQYVVVRQEELDAVAPKKSRTIEIQDFVAISEIDPVYFDRTYYVGPQESGAKAYRLLVEAMEKSKRIAVARLVMHNKEYLAALRPVNGALCMETMHFSDEVVPLEEVSRAVPPTRPDEREVKMAEQLIDSLAGPFKPEKYHDEYQAALKQMVEKKAQGQQVVSAPQPQQPAGQIGNLLEALQASLVKARAGGTRNAEEEVPGAKATKDEPKAKADHRGESRRRRKKGS